MPLSQVGTALKKLMPKYRIKRYGCKTLGELYERLDRYELVKTEKGGGGDGEKGKRIRGIVIIQYLIIEDRRNSSCLSSYNLIKVYKHTTNWFSLTHPLLMLFFLHIIDSCKYLPSHNYALFFL